MKADIFLQFGIMTVNDAVDVMKKIREEFGLDLDEMEATII